MRQILRDRKQAEAPRLVAKERERGLRIGVAGQRVLKMSPRWWHSLKDMVSATELYTDIITMGFTGHVLSLK